MLIVEFFDVVMFKSIKVNSSLLSYLMYLQILLFLSPKYNTKAANHVSVKFIEQLTESRAIFLFAQTIYIDQSHCGTYIRNSVHSPQEFPAINYHIVIRFSWR